MGQEIRWNPEQYKKFISERTRPALELLARVKLSSITNAIDLGCGPGNSTALLKQRWPDARIVGLDNSKDMLVAASKDYPEIEFICDDINQWQPDSPVDLIFANAVFQWLPNHQLLLPRLASYLKKGGVLAMQMPVNSALTTHSCMQEVTSRYKWSIDLTRILGQSQILDSQSYYDIFSEVMKKIDIWETQYFHVMDSIENIVEWAKGTVLCPFLSALPNQEQSQFLECYREKIKEAFKAQEDGKFLFPYPRLFAVVSK